MAAPSPRRLAREDGITLAVAVEGAGPTALLLHGFTLSSAMWTENGVAPALAGRFRVVAPDLRGHGDSDRPTQGDSDSVVVLPVTGVT